MNPAWQQFLSDRGLPAHAQPASGPQTTITDLSHLGVIEVSGAEAGTFLHGQLTTDVAALPPNRGQFSAWCTAKGQVIAVLLLLRAADRFLVFLPRAQCAAFANRLRMFVLRANVRVTDRSAEWVRFGVSASGSTGFPAELGTASQAPWQVVERDDLTLLCLPDTGTQRRVIVCGELAAAQSLWTALGARCAVVTPSAWELQDIHAGIPWLAPPLAEKFLPQELGLASVGALSLDKGCYPGQEIIARVHFRGRPKRGLYHFNVDADAIAAAGTVLHLGSGDARAAGTVIGAQIAHDSTQLGLAVCELESAAKPGWRLGAADGPPVTINKLIK